MRTDRERLEDILTAIDKIVARTQPSGEMLVEDEMLQVWVLHHLQIIGEACRSRSEGFKRDHPDTVWAEAAGLRHILVHHYFEIDGDQIRRVVENDLNPLRKKAANLLQR